MEGKNGEAKEAKSWVREETAEWRFYVNKHFSYIHRNCIINATTALQTHTHAQNTHRHACACTSIIHTTMLTVRRV